MSTKTHTPGPWDVETPFDGFSIVEAGKPTFEWRFIAHVPTEKENGIHFLEAEANARLISAAPNLLEALAAIVAHGVPLSGGLLSLAEAAIRKARGE